MQTRAPQLLAAVMASVLLVASAANVRGGELVIPSALENVEGNTNGGALPFHTGSLSARHQQIYSSTEFSGPVLINEIRFRPDGVFGNSFSSNLLLVEINMSTTSAAVDALSPTFSANAGADETEVFLGTLSLSSSNTGAGPRDFDIVVPLSTPFPYDPAAGNLLLDVRNFFGGSTTALDADSSTIDTTSRTSTALTVEDVNSPTGSLTNSIGLVTKFVFEPAVMEVAIDVKPDSEDNPVKLRSNGGSRTSSSAGGVIPVAILTTDDFDATTIDPDSMILLGDPALGAAVPPIRGALEDVDDDGDLDVLLHFSIRELVEAEAIDNETLFLMLTASTLDGMGIAGLDLVAIVPRSH